MRSGLGLFAFILCLASAAEPSYAADYAVIPAKVAPAKAGVIYVDRGPNPYCGPRCGCPTVVHVRHRSLHQTYGYMMDPRTKDEPHYYYGANRTYVRFVNPRDPDRVLTY